jgi:DNA-binding NarL/FixJ family response regulator
MGTLRLYVAEESRVLREGLAAIIERAGDFKIVSSASERESLFETLRQTSPDVLLLDIAGLTDGVQLAQAVRLRFPTLKIVVMNAGPSQPDIVELVKAGVSAFVLKSATLQELANTLRTVAAGGHVLPPALTAALFAQVASVSSTPRGARNGARMTWREREIVELISAGLSNKEIAHRLNIATHTVKSHVHNLLEKFAVHTRAQLAALSLEGTNGDRAAVLKHPVLSRD